MMFQRIATFAVIAEPLASAVEYLWCLVQWFEQAAKAAEEGQEVVGQVDEYVLLFVGVFVVADEDGVGGGFDLVHEAVGDEAFWAEAPEQAVHLLAFGQRLAMDEHPVACGQGLVGQAAGEQQAVDLRLVFGQVEVNAGHLP